MYMYSKQIVSPLPYTFKYFHTFIGVYEEALLDISVVLIQDPKHTKARARRARIYEAQVYIILHILQALYMLHLYIILMHYSRILYLIYK